MSLGGASGYMQPGGNSAPLDQSTIPYLPYAQQGPYQAIMSQMGNYGGGNLYGGAGGGAMGGFNPDLYKRAAAAAPVVADMKSGSGTRGGGGSGRTSFEPGAGLAQFGGSGFSAGVSPYANQLAAFLGNLGFTGISDALAKNVDTNYGNEGKNAPPSVVGDTNYSNEARNYVAPAPTVSDGGFNPISGYSIAPAPEAPAPVAVSSPVTYSPIVSNDIASNDNYSNDGYSRGYDGGGDRSYSAPSNGGESGGWGSRDAGGDSGGGGDYKGGYIKASMLYGPDPAGPDEGYRALKSGEYVINDKSVKKYGIDLMNAINSGKISKGKLRGLLEM